MRIPTWRILLTGGAIAVLAVGGIGLTLAANGPATPAAAVANPAATTGPGASRGPLKPSANIGALRQELRQIRGQLNRARLLRLGRHLVHADVTVTDKDGNLVHLQLDHGTVASIGGGSLAIGEQGGATVTVSTDDQTIVWLGRSKGSLTDVKGGVEVFVQSSVDGGTKLAKRILVVREGPVAAPGLVN